VSLPAGTPLNPTDSHDPMRILGIDTSCDDTSAAIVVDGRVTLSNVVHSQLSLHHPYGGVVPELASREHLRNIVDVVDAAFDRASMGRDDLDGIAVTVGPGLIGSLLVGLYYAKALSYVLGIPFVGINHLEGHILSVFLEAEAPPFPFVALTVSGGHTSLYHVEGFGRYTSLGQTLTMRLEKPLTKLPRFSAWATQEVPSSKNSPFKGAMIRFDSLEPISPPAPWISVSAG
jgi:glycoprotease/Kae1 family metallohydrolase